MFEYNRALRTYVNVCTYMHFEWKPLHPLYSWSGPILTDTFIVSSHNSCVCCFLNKNFNYEKQNFFNILGCICFISILISLNKKRKYTRFKNNFILQIKPASCSGYYGAQTRSWFNLSNEVLFRGSTFAFLVTVQTRQGCMTVKVCYWFCD